MSFCFFVEQTVSGLLSDSRFLAELHAQRTPIHFKESAVAAKARKGSLEITAEGIVEPRPRPALHSTHSPKLSG